MTLRRARAWTVIAMALALAACSGAAKKPTPPTASSVRAPGAATAGSASRVSPYAPAQEDPGKRGNYTRGGLYAPGVQDSAPDGIADVGLIPEPEVRNEPRSRYGNRSPYVVLGKAYTVLDDPASYDEVGLASFYGRKFHGRRTSNLEVYDMYALTAAHKTLPLPSFVRVTNLANGKSVVVRVNDRGPFVAGRIIDLSYAAAVKLGMDRAGTARVQVRGLSPGDARTEPDTALAQRTPPQRPSGPPARLAANRLAPTPIDRLAAALPIVAASAAPPALASSSGAAADPAGERFDMLQGGRPMTADGFERWMRARQLRVATGKPASVAAIGEVAGADPSAADAATAGEPATLILQVASFAARANAEQALRLLNGAGIDGARVLDAQANGRKVWRLRVGPIATAAMPELLARIRGLGFGPPQRVRE